MYPFIRHEVGWLVIHESRPAAGQRHLKSFLLPTRPQDQPTLNLYVAGEFSVEFGDQRLTLAAGQSSLDLGDAPIPAGAIVTETALSTNCVRFCMQPIDPRTKWSRRRVELAAGESVRAADGFVVPMTDPLVAVERYVANQPVSVFVIERL